MLEQVMLEASLWLRQLFCRHQWCAWLDRTEICAHCLKTKKKRQVRPTL